MRTFLYTIAFFTGLILFTATTGRTQVRVDANLDIQPEWGPSGYEHAEYYYLPDIDVYYSVMTERLFIRMVADGYTGLSFRAGTGIMTFTGVTRLLLMIVVHGCIMMIIIAGTLYTEAAVTRLSFMTGEIHDTEEDLVVMNENQKR